MERLKEALSAAGIAYKENEPLCAHCTFRIGGPADLFVLPENEEQLCAAIRLAKEAGVKSYLLGNGSNILFEDAGYRGAVINVSAMKSGIGVIENISFPGKDPALTYDAVVVGAGQMLSSLCMAALENSLTGLEFALRHPRHGGRCGLHERRCLRRRDEGCAGLGAVSDRGGGDR